MAWDPLAPETLGIDWDVATESVLPLSTPTTCAAFWIDSSVTETIDQIIIPHTWDGSATGYGKLWTDIYSLADLGVAETPTVYTFTPNEDLGVTNMFYTASGTAAWSVGPYSVNTQNLDQYVDDTTDESTDYIMGGSTSVTKFAFNTAALAAGRVLYVTLEFRAFSYSGFPGQGIGIDLYNNTTYVARLGSITPPVDGDDIAKPFRTYTVGPFYTNPLTEEPWTRTDIINMDTGTNLLIQLTWKSNTTAVAAVRMKVGMITEKRVAVGPSTKQTSLPSGMQTNLPISLKSAAGVDNWGKASGTDYLVVVRRLDDPLGLASTLIPQPVYIDGETSPNVHGQAYSDVTIDAAGALSASGSVSTTRTFPFWLGTVNGTTLSVDAMPYWDLVLKPVYTGIGNVRQGFHNASAQTYKGVRLLVGYSGTPTANLTIQAKRVSDNVQLGGDGTVTTALVTAGTLVGTVTDATYGAISVYSVLINLASSATLAGSVAYYFDITSSTTSGNPWLLVMLDATASHSLTGNVTHGGSTQQATAAGVAVAHGDFVISIQSSVVAPSSVTAASASTTINGVTVPYVDVDWVDGGAIGASFERWEVERSEDSGTTYTAVAYVETEATVTFHDYEAQRGATLKYRVRKVRTDGATTDYTTQSDTTTLTATGGLTVFTSNAEPTLTVGYYVMGTDTSYQFNTANETTFLRLHDRDYAAAFKPLEQRGITWSFPAAVHGGPSAPSSGEGVQTFDALRAIAESTEVTYVCMHTGDGERFFGSLQVHEGRRNQPAKVYVAQVTFTETQATSAAVTV